MPRKHAIRDPNEVHFVTCTVVQWIDVFTRDIYREIIFDCLKYCQREKGLEIFAYCLMTNHLHLLIRAKEGFHLSDILRDFKSFTSRHIRKALEENDRESRKEWMLWMFKRAGFKNERNKDFQFWQQHNHPVEMSDNAMIDQRLEYLHENPVKAGFVARPEDWLWSSARDYAGVEKGVVELVYV